MEAEKNKADSGLICFVCVLAFGSFGFFLGIALGLALNAPLIAIAFSMTVAFSILGFAVSLFVIVLADIVDKLKDIKTVLEELKPEE